ncbi:hypothetical protein C8J56DRAFT_791555 [Mycena floridula]|nr:hypothetical protein C8J56DRAFT_791555 [Mycena floridula]
MRGTDSLRDYLRLSSLPCMINSPHAPAMPPPGHKSHLNHLAIIPTHYRCLVQVRQFRIDASELGDSILSETGLEQNVPNRALGVDDIDPETCHRLALPCPSKPAYDIPPTVMLKPESLEKVGAWIENLPLTTAARAFALMHPDKPGWEFTSVPGGKDGDIFRSFFWTLRDNPRRTFTPQEHIEIAKQSVVVAYQPPWILSDQDMFEFCSSQDYPSYDQQYSEPFTSKARLWGKIWDTCVTSQCYYFVLTSYNKWAFGKFSEGYKDAYVTEAFDFNMQGPSIAELLLAWLIAPTDDDLKTRIVPEVCGEMFYISYQYPCTVHDVFMQRMQPSRALYFL